MKNLALHQISYMKDAPFGLIEMAAKAGLSHICLFTHSPDHQNGEPMFPIIKRADEKRFRAQLQIYHVQITNIEYFPIMPGEDVERYRAALALGARLGAKRAVTHIHDDSPRRARAQLLKLTEIAAEMGLETGLEFTGFAAGCNTLHQAVEIKKALGHPMLKIAVDALHFFRTGGQISDLYDIGSDDIGYAQICDGKHLNITSDYLDEAMNRMSPGTGRFPLTSFLRTLPADIDMDIEVPCFNAAPPYDAESWATKIVAATRAVLQTVDGKTP